MLGLSSITLWLSEDYISHAGLLHTYDKAFNATWATRQSSSDNDQIGRRFMWQTREVAYNGIPLNNELVQAVPGWITFPLSAPSLIELWDMVVEKERNNFLAIDCE